MNLVQRKSLFFLKESLTFFKQCSGSPCFFSSKQQDKNRSFSPRKEENSSENRKKFNKNTQNIQKQTEYQKNIQKQQKNPINPSQSMKPNKNVPQFKKEEIIYQNKWNWLENFDDFKEQVLPISTDLSKISKLLKELSNKLPRPDEFESKYLKNYTFIVSEILTSLRSKKLQESDIPLMIDLLHSQATFYNRLGKIETAKLSVFRKKACKEITERLPKLEAEPFLKFIDSLQLYDFKSGSLNQEISKASIIVMKKLKPEQFLGLLFNLGRIGFKDEVVIEMITEKLFHIMETIDLKNKVAILTNLNIMHFRPNKIFLVEICNSICKEAEGYPDGELYYEYAPVLLFNLSDLEKRYTGGLFYIDQLDKTYELIVKSLRKNMEKYRIIEVFRIANGLQRAAIYDETLLKKIQEMIIDQEFFGFSEIDPSEKLQTLRNDISKINSELHEFKLEEKLNINYKTLLIDLRKKEREEKMMCQEIKNNFNHLNGLFGILHAFAVCNHAPKQFLKFCYEIIELYYLKYVYQKEGMIEFLDPSKIPRAIWSLCVLDSPDNIKKSVKYLVNTLLRADEQKYTMSHADITQIYYSIIYLEDTGVYDSETRDQFTKVYQELTKGTLKTISMMHLDLCESLKRLQIGHTIEENINNIAVDIILEDKTKDEKKIVIDFHGYNHFFRNTEKLKGKGVFKRKLLEQLKCVYLEVRIMDWLLLDEKGKDKFMIDLLKPHISYLK